MPRGIYTRKPLTEDHKANIRRALKIRHPMSGRKHTEESRKKMSKAQSGSKHHLFGTTRSLETRLKMSLSAKGKPKSYESKKRMSAAKIGKYIGEKHPNWQGGITKENVRIRNSREYKLWRTAVFERDNYTCVQCGERGVYLNADHIKPFALFPELRFELSNGRTLCIPCHSKTDTYKGRVNKKYLDKLAPQRG